MPLPSTLTVYTGYMEKTTVASGMLIDMGLGTSNTVYSSLLVCNWFPRPR